MVSALNNELWIKVLQYKLMYYHPEAVHPSWHKELTISDQEYDGWELQLPKRRRCVGYPDRTRLGRIVAEKLAKEKLDGTETESQ